MTEQTTDACRICEGIKQGKTQTRRGSDCQRPCRNSLWPLFLCTSAINSMGKDQHSAMTSPFYKISALYCSSDTTIYHLLPTWEKMRTLCPPLCSCTSRRSSRAILPHCSIISSALGYSILPSVSAVIRSAPNQHSLHPMQIDDNPWWHMPLQPCKRPPAYASKSSLRLVKGESAKANRVQLRDRIQQQKSEGQPADNPVDLAARLVRWLIKVQDTGGKHAPGWLQFLRICMSTLLSFTEALRPPLVRATSSIASCAHTPTSQCEQS